MTNDTLLFLSIWFIWATTAYSRDLTFYEMQQQSNASRSQNEKLKAIWDTWSAEFKALPKTLQEASCDEISTQERKAQEFKEALDPVIKLRQKILKNHPMWDLDSSKPLLEKLQGLAATYEAWPAKARGLKVSIIDQKISVLRVLNNEEYFIAHAKWKDEDIDKAITDARQTLVATSCNPEQLKSASDEIDALEPKIKTLAANETKCRASRKCMRQRALDEAMTSTVPNICDDIEDIRLSRQEMARLRSNPSGVVDRYRLMETGERIQAHMAEMAILKATFAKETGQQFSERLCSKVQQ